MDLLMVPVVWAQAAAGNAASSSSSGSGSLALLALRRWFVSLTLSSPEATPTLYGLWAWVGGLIALFFLVIFAQGPLRVLQQIFDIPGHFRLFSASVLRLRRSSRVVAVTIGMTVVAWTASQTAWYSRPQGKEDLILLTKSRSLTEVTLEQGTLAAVTPLRDVLGLGSNLPLLCIAALLVFRICADRWANPTPYTDDARGIRTGWANPIWMCASIFLIYRLAALAGQSNDSDALRDLPWQGCLMIEPVLIPFLMAICDGFLLAWILVELRNASLGDTGNELFDPKQAISLMPAAALACMVTLPARYVATGIWLAAARVPGTFAANYLRWQLTWGLADIQGAALMAIGLIGAVAWSRGSVVGAIRGFGRLLAAEGGHLLTAVALAGATAGAGAALAYVILLSLPAQTWVLSAADSYAHYATLPVGLITLAAVVELGERSLPIARLAQEPQSNPA